MKDSIRFWLYMFISPYRIVGGVHGIFILLGILGAVSFPEIPGMDWRIEILIAGSCIAVGWMIGRFVSRRLERLWRRRSPDWWS